MRALVMIILEILVNGRGQSRNRERNDAAQALLLEAAKEAFDERIAIRRSGRNPNDVKTAQRQQMAESLGERGITIHDHESAISCESTGCGQVSRLLCHP